MSNKRIVKFKPKWFYDPIFRVNFYVFFGKGRDVFAKWVEKEHKVALDTEGEAAGCSWSVDNKQYIWIEDKRNLGHLCHEALHAAISVLCDVGIEVRRDNQEPLCYYHMWIFNELLKARK